MQTMWALDECVCTSRLYVSPRTRYYDCYVFSPCVFSVEILPSSAHSTMIFMFCLHAKGHITERLLKGGWLSTCFQLILGVTIEIPVSHVGFNSNDL